MTGSTCTATSTTNGAWRVGCCVPSAGAHALNTLPARKLVSPAPTLKIDTVHDWYRAATRADPFPGEWEPDDTGSSAVALGGVLRSRGLIGQYQWAFGFAPSKDAFHNERIGDDEAIETHVVAQQVGQDRA